MSIEVMTAVWDYSTAYGGDLVMMLAIANYADINGRAYPSIRTLAQRGRMTERNTQYCIKKLEALGELKVEKNAGPHGTHVFQIILQGAKFSGCKVFTHQKKSKSNKELTVEGEKIAGENFSGVQSFQTETHFTGGVKPISPDPSLDPSVIQKIEDTLPTLSSPVPKKKGRQKVPEHPLPEDWQPSEKNRGSILTKYPGADLDRLVDAMESWAHSKGVLKCDWEAELRTFARLDWEKRGAPQRDGRHKRVDEHGLEYSEAY